MASNPAFEFLWVLFDGLEGVIELRPLPIIERCFARPSEVTTLLDFVARHPTNLYVGVATRKLGSTTGTLADCHQLGALYLDIDFKTIPEPEARRRLVEFPIQPGLVVQSGHGLHVYWLLREPFTLPADEPRARQLLLRLAAYFQGDPACAEPAHILRVPGTINHKVKEGLPPVPVRLERCEPTWRINPSELEDLLPVGAPEPVGQTFTLPETIPEGRRRPTLYALARALKTKALSREAVLAALQVENARRCVPPLAPEQLQAQVESAFSQKDRPGFEPRPIEPAPGVTGAPTPCTLATLHLLVRRWLGPEYDLAVPTVVLAAAAAHRINAGIPVWILVVSGPGAGKTEIVQVLEGAGARVESVIKSEAALLSGSPRRDRTPHSTGGLLHEIGADGILVIKDLTTMLSMHRTTRDELLAAFREIHDGRWSRLVGTDGGRRVAWAGRLTVVAACTSHWDRAHDVIATMGDRFVVVRLDSRYGRRAAFDQAIRNGGGERQMRHELAEATEAVMAGLDVARIEPLSPEDLDRIFDAADATTLARGGVNTDYQHNVIEADEPEMATRFGKQLIQLIRGAMALGLSKAAAIQLGIRCARDSVPPLRFEVLEDINLQPGTLATHVWKRLNRPRNTVQRCLDALLDMRCLYTTEDQDGLKYHIQTDMTKGISAMSSIVIDP